MAIHLWSLLSICSAFVVRAHRDSESSGDQVAGHLVAASSSEAGSNSNTGAFATTESEVDRELHVRKLNKEIIEQCRQAQEAREAGKETKETVKTLGGCIDELAKIARSTQKQREVSREANRLYAEDVIMAKKMLAYLNKKMDAGEEEFNRYRKAEKRKEQELTDLMHRIGGGVSSALQLGGMETTQQPQFSALQTQQIGVPAYAISPSQFANSGTMFSPTGQSFGMPSNTGGLAGQPSFLPAYAISPSQFANSGPMVSPTGQSFGMPSNTGGLAGQPSLLQLGKPSPWNGVPGVSDLQAKLDREAQSLEERGVTDDMDAF